MVRTVAFFFAASILAAQPKSLLLEDYTWTELRDAIAGGKTTAIYYSGSIEQNGPGMALGKHVFIARYVAQRIAEKLGNAIVYPTMPFAPTGDPVRKTGHMRFPGTINVSAETFRAVAHDVAVSALAAGFKDVVLISDHGGAAQEALKEVAAHMKHVYYIPDLYFKEKNQAAKYLTEHKMVVDQHAGAHDTSQLMYIDSERRWVRKDKLVAGNGTNGVEGDPTKSSAEIGKIFINWKIDDAVAQIRQLVR